MTCQWKCDYFHCFSVNSEPQCSLTALLCLEGHFGRPWARSGLPSLCLYSSHLCLFDTLCCSLIFIFALLSPSEYFWSPPCWILCISPWMQHEGALGNLIWLHIHLLISNVQWHALRNPPHSPNSHALSHLFLFANLVSTSWNDPPLRENAFILCYARCSFRVVCFP